MKKIITLLALAFCLNGKAQCSLYVDNEPAHIYYTSDTIPVCSGTTYWAGGATSYTWMPGGITTNTIVLQNTPTTYTLTGTTGTCTATYTFVTKINPTTPVSFISTSNTACMGAGDTIIPYANAQTYSWSPSNAFTQHPFSNAIIATPTVATTYTLVVTNGGCVGTGTINIGVNPSPTVSYTLTADASPHTWDAYATYSGGTPPYNYSWFWDDGTYSYTDYPSHIYASAGTYYISVTITDANGCSSTFGQTEAVSRLGGNNSLSTMVYVNVLQPQTTGIHQLSSGNNQATIYPNPTQTNFIIETNNTDKQTLQIFDVNGKLVLTQTINGKTNIDASNLAEGVYNLSLINANGVVNKRLVIVK